MFVNNIIIAATVVSMTSTTYAVGWVRQLCDQKCTQEKCQSDVKMKESCNANCQSFPDVLAACNASALQPAAAPSGPPSQQPLAIPTKPALQPQQRFETKSVPESATAVSPEALYLEKIGDRLLFIRKNECKKLVDETNRQWVNTIPSKPAGYEKKYKTGAKEYKSAADYKHIFEQIDQSFRDLQNRVAKLVVQAKDPNNKKDLVDIFQEIYLDIDLNGRKNCEKYTTTTNDALKAQQARIDQYNKKHQPIIQKVTNQFKKKEIITQQ